MEKLRFSFVLPQKLAGMSWPGFVTKPQDVVDFLNAERVKIVVNLTTSPFINSTFSTNFNLVHENVSNMCAPDCAQMDRVYREFLTLADGESMAIHCMHGLGRTGTALACIVGQTNNLSAPNAISFIRQIRPGSIESREQELFITQYLEDHVHDNY